MALDPAAFAVLLLIPLTGTLAAVLVKGFDGVLLLKGFNGVLVADTAAVLATLPEG